MVIDREPRHDHHARPLAEVVAAERRCDERAWYSVHRHLGSPAEGEETASILEPKYDDLVIRDPYPLIVLHGRLAALRWALGDE